MTKTLLSGVAAIAFAFAAPNAFAQDSNVDTDIDATMKTEQMIDKVEEAADDLEEKTDELADTQDEMWDTETKTMDDSADNMDSDVESESYSSPSIDCPDGATVQADGTCLTVDEQPEI